MVTVVLGTSSVSAFEVGFAEPRLALLLLSLPPPLGVGVGKSTYVVDIEREKKKDEREPSAVRALVLSEAS